MKCDIAIVPIGGTYTMDAKKSAELVNTLRPDIAIPVHYGSMFKKKSKEYTVPYDTLYPIPCYKGIYL